MPRSKLTYDELEAQAMLLGMSYDENDHTMLSKISGENYRIFCADTMEEYTYSQYFRNVPPTDRAPYPDSYYGRIYLVNSGEMGAADHGEVKDDV